MRRHAWALAALLAFPAVARSQEPTDAEKGTPEERYQRLLKEYQSQQEAFSRAYQEAKTDAERQKVLREKAPDPSKFLPRFLALAEEDPKSRVGFDALMWIIQNDRNGRVGIAAKAFDLLEREYLADERLAKVVPLLLYSFSRSAERLLRDALEKSPHREVKALACLTLAERSHYFAGFFRRADEPKDEPAAKARRESLFGRDYARELEAKGDDGLDTDALALFERAKAEFADVKLPRGTVGESAEHSIFELTNLLIGKPAPEIAGKDIDGKEMKLSDYRGKVVVLDFWGDW
jgi:hypothetical protein